MTKEYEFDIIISEETRKAAGDAVRLRDAGMVQVKGVAEPMRIFTPER